MSVEAGYTEQIAQFIETKWTTFLDKRSKSSDTSRAVASGLFIRITTCYFSGSTQSDHNFGKGT